MEDVLDKLFGYAFDHQVGVTADNYADDWVPVAIPSKCMILINLNWNRREEIPFQVAHEIAHVLAGGEDFAAYHRCATDPAEYTAHVGAVRILVDLFTDDTASPETVNMYDFMERFRIPSHLEGVVREALLSKFA